MLYHYIFKTYLGRPTLEDKELRIFLKDTFVNISTEKGFKVIECEILSEHIHLLIEQSYLDSTSKIMKLLKGVSSRRLFQKYHTNRFEHRKLWARSFYARKINNEEKEDVGSYIRKQRNENGVDKRY